MSRINPLPISVHDTMYGKLEVNWKKDYDGSLKCPECFGNQFWVIKSKSNICKVAITCIDCRYKTALTCPIQAHTFSFQPGKPCPNPLCNQVGPDGKTKGWIYLECTKKNSYECYFCKIRFVDSDLSRSWAGQSKSSPVKPFHFEDDLWDLRNFYNEPQKLKVINFSMIQPDWYQYQVKQYLFHILKSQSLSNGTIGNLIATLRQFALIIQRQNLCSYQEIARQNVLAYLDEYCSDGPGRIVHKLTTLKSFFNWLQLDYQQLIRSSDYPKVSKDSPDWLDEVVRISIHQNLSKLPPPIARQYLVQEYTAARPKDACQILFDCLVEEDGKWYIKFYQHKVSRWHRLPANREIRQVIEKQQCWIRQNLPENYQYLFCHFRGIRASSYPTFPAMKPIPKPPLVLPNSNPMVRLVRLLIEQENICDANGQPPDFTGKITRSSRLQEIRTLHGMEASQLYADHKTATTTFQHYAPPTQEQVAKVDLAFQELLLNPNNKFLPWQSLPESLLKTPQVHELDIEIAPRLVVYGYCTLNPKTPCPYNLYPKCYSCSSFRPSTNKLPLYERQYEGEKKRMTEAQEAKAELAYEEAKETIEAMEKWLFDLKELTND